MYAKSISAATKLIPTDPLKILPDPVKSLPDFKLIRYIGVSVEVSEMGLADFWTWLKVDLMRVFLFFKVALLISISMKKVRSKCRNIKERENITKNMAFLT